MKMVFWLVMLVAVMGYKETNNSNIGNSNYSNQIGESIKQSINKVTDVCTDVATDVFSAIEYKIEEYSK